MDQGPEKSARRDYIPVAIVFPFPVRQSSDNFSIWKQSGIKFADIMQD